MPASWPSQFQQYLNAESFSYKVGSTVLRSDMGVGPAKVRRLVTKSVDTISCTIYLPFSLWQDFQDFFDIDLNGGATTFNFPHPFTGTLTEFRMSDAPTYTPIGGVQMRVQMTWEKLP